MSPPSWGFHVSGREDFSLRIEICYLSERGFSYSLALSLFRFPPSCVETWTLLSLSLSRDYIMRIAKNDIRRALTIAKANAKKGSSLSGDAGFKTIQRVFENRIPFTAHHGYLPHVSHCGEKGSLSKFQKRLSLLDWLLFQRNLSEISNHGKEERLLKLLPVSACILVKKDFQEISCHGEKSTLSAIWEMSYDSIWQGVRKEVLDCRSTSQVSKDPALEKSIQHYRSRRDRGWHRSQNFRPLNVIRDFSTRLSLSRCKQIVFDLAIIALFLFL